MEGTAIAKRLATCAADSVVGASALAARQVIEVAG